MTATTEGDMASDMRRLVIHLPINYNPILREDHYAAQVEQFGMTVYAPTREDLEPRIEKAIQFYLKGFGEELGQVFAYFCRNQIAYSVEYDPPDSPKCDTSDKLTVQVPT